MPEFPVEEALADRPNQHERYIDREIADGAFEAPGGLVEGLHSDRPRFSWGRMLVEPDAAAAGLQHDAEIIEIAIDVVFREAGVPEGHFQR
jgi:hypothetical protein